MLTGGAGVHCNARPGQAEMGGELPFERCDLGALCEHSRAKHSINGRAFLRTDERLRGGNEIGHLILPPSGLGVSTPLWIACMASRTGLIASIRTGIAERNTVASTARPSCVAP